MKEAIKMAKRSIRTGEETVLRKVSKEVTKFDDALHALIDDMIETMYEAEGVGLAAPQIGLLKRLFVVDIGEGPVEFVNPTVLEQDGEQIGEEGCLSVPGKYGTVKRSNRIKMRAQNRHGQWFEIQGEGFMARAMQHEFDHLEGKLFIDLVEGDLVEYTGEEYSE